MGRKLLLAPCMLFAAAPFLCAREVTYVDVAPILYKHCAGCHHPNDIAPMGEVGLRGARPGADCIPGVVLSKKMPPWKADPRYGTWSNDWSLRDSEIAAIKA